MQQVHHGQNVPWSLSWPAVPSLAFPQNLPHGFRGCLRTFVCSVFTSASCRHSPKQQMQQVHHGQNVPWSLSWPAVPSLAFPQNLPHGFRGCLRTFVCSVFTSASCRLSPKQQMQQVHHGQNVPWSLSWPAVPSLAFPQNLPHGFRGCLRTFVCSVFTSASCRHSPKQQMQQVHHGQNVPWWLSWPAVPSLAFPQNLPHGFRGCLRTFVCSVFTSASCRHSPKQQMQQVHHGQNVPWSLSWPAVPSLAFPQNLPHGFRGCLRTFVCSVFTSASCRLSPKQQMQQVHRGQNIPWSLSWPAVPSLAFPQNLPHGFRGCLRTFVCSIFTSASCRLSPKQQMQQVHHGQNVPWLLSWPAVPSLAFPQNLPHGFRGCLRTFVCSVFTSASCRLSPKQQMQQVHHGQNVPWSLSWPAVPSLAFPQNLPHGFRGCLRTFVCSVFTSASCRLSPKQQMQQVHHGQNIPWSLSWPAVPSLAFPQNLPHGFRGCLRTFVCSVFTSASWRHSLKQQMQQVHHGQNVPWLLSWPAVPSLAFPQNLPHGFRGCLRTFVCSVFTSASCRHSPKQQMQQVHHGQNVPWSLSWPAVPSLAFPQNLPHGFRGCLRTFVCSVFTSASCRHSPKQQMQQVHHGQNVPWSLSWPAVPSLAFPQNLPHGFRGCLRTFKCVQVKTFWLLSWPAVPSLAFPQCFCLTRLSPPKTANAASSPWSKRSLVAELACCAEPRVSAEFAARLQRLFEDLRVQRFHQCFLQTFSQTANAASSPWSKRSLVAELACCAEPRVSAEFAARLQRLFEDLRVQRFHQCFLQTFSQTANAASSPWSKRSLVAELACCAEPRVSAEFAARLQRLFEDLRVQRFHQCFLQTFSQTANAASSPWSKRSLVAELACCAEPRVSAEFAARLQRLFEDLRVQRFHQCFLQTFSQTANAASSPWSKRSLVAELACCAEPRVSAEFATRLQRLFEDLGVQRFRQCFLQTFSQTANAASSPWSKRSLVAELACCAEPRVSAEFAARLQRLFEDLPVQHFSPVLLADFLPNSKCSKFTMVKTFLGR